MTALVSNLLLLVSEVNGGILALPLLLLGTWMLFSWLGSGGVAWAAGAGAAAAGAVSIKQNLVVVVAAALLGLALLLAGRGRWRRVLRGALWFTAGAGVVVAAVLVLARSRGTDLAGALGRGRGLPLDAGRVIAAEASPATGDRAGWLAAAFVGTGAPVVLLLLAGLGGACVVRTTATRSRSPGWWRCCWSGRAARSPSGAATGSTTSSGPCRPAAARRPGPAGRGGAAHAPRRAGGGGLVAVTTSTLVGQAAYAVRPPQRGVDEQAVVDYVRSRHDRPATGVVAFGSVDILVPPA